jgi:hypothetical protein
MHWPHWLPLAAQSQQHQQPALADLMFVSVFMLMTIAAAIIVVAVMIAHRAMLHRTVVAHRVWLRALLAIWAFAVPVSWMLRRAVLWFPVLIAGALIGLYLQTSVVARSFAAKWRQLSLKKKNPLWRKPRGFFYLC